MKAQKIQLKSYFMWQGVAMSNWELFPIIRGINAAVWYKWWWGLLIIFCLLKGVIWFEEKYMSWRKDYRQRKIYTGKTQWEPVKRASAAGQAWSSHLTVRVQLFSSASSFNAFAAMQTTINKWKSKGNVSLRTRHLIQLSCNQRSQKPISLNAQKVDI